MNIAESDRLILRYLKPDDDAFMLKLMNSSTWLKYIGDRHIISEMDARNYLISGPIKSYQEHGVGMFGITLKESNILIGVCGLVKREYLDDFDLGYALLPNYEGKGYAFEASQAVLSFVANTTPMKRIVAFTTEYNKRSRKLLNKLGFRFEKVFQLGDEECMLFEKSIK